MLMLILMKITLILIVMINNLGGFIIINSSLKCANILRVVSDEISSRDH